MYKNSIGKTSQSISRFLLMSVLVVSFLFALVPANIFANDNVEAPMYADKDFVIVTAEYVDEGKNYIIGAESEDKHNLDWLVYVIELDQKEVSSQLDFVQYAQSNRATYLSEDHVVETIYVPAKGLFRYFDLAGFGFDWFADKSGLTPKDTVTIPADDGKVYLIRAYSGALGIQDDKGEWGFVKNNIDEGQSRMATAMITNAIVGAIDIASPAFPAVESLNDPVLQKRLNKAITKATVKITAKMSGGTTGTDELLVAMKDASKILMKEMAGYAGDMIKEEVRKNAMERFTTFLENTVEGAVNMVNVTDDISKYGQALNRVYDLVYSGTPLETAYVINTPLAVAEEEEIDGEAPEDIDVTDNVPKQTDLQLQEMKILSAGDGGAAETSGPALEKENTAIESDLSSALSTAMFAPERITVRFVNQYGYPYNPPLETNGFQQLEGYLLDALGQRVEGDFNRPWAPGGNTFTIFNKTLPAGSYTLYWDGGSAWAPGSPVRRYFDGGNAEFSVPDSSGNWYVEIPVKQTGIKYVDNQSAHVRAEIVNAVGTPLIIDNSFLGHDVFSFEHIETGDVVTARREDMNLRESVMFSANGLRPGEHRITIKKGGYQTYNQNLVIPDRGSWTDEQILGQRPTKIDLGKITLVKSE